MRNTSAFKHTVSLDNTRIQQYRFLSVSLVVAPDAQPCRSKPPRRPVVRGFVGMQKCRVVSSVTRLVKLQITGLLTFGAWDRSVG